VVGPLVAPDEEVAAGLISDLAERDEGVRLDLVDTHSDLIAWALGQGFTEGNQTAVMVLGEPLPGDRTRLVCPVTVALG
jgi:hypothetical protein